MLFSVFSHFLNEHLRILLWLANTFNHFLIPIEFVVIKHKYKHMEKSVDIVFATGRVKVQFVHTGKLDYTMEILTFLVTGYVLSFRNVFCSQTKIDKCYLELTVRFLSNHDVLLL